MKKMIVSDYDGTFYRNEEELKENIKLIEAYRKNGNLFVIATGRAYTSFMVEYEKNNLPFDYLILSGGMLLDKDLNVLYYESIEKDVIDHLNLDIKRYEKYITQCKYVGLKTSSEESLYPLTKIAMRFNDVLKGYEFSTHVLNLYKTINCYVLALPHATLVEIISNKTNKGIALKALEKISGIDPKNIYTIGDSSNDLEMIQMYDGYMVDTAQTDLKQQMFKVATIKDLTLK